MIRPTRIGHVVLKARDLKEAETFYTEVLGFEVVTRLRKPRGIFFSLGEQHHDLAVLEVDGGDEGPQKDAIGVHHIALRLKNLTELKEGYHTLKQNNVRITGTIDHGITKSVYFLDPAGNQFELYYDVGTDGLERIRRGEGDALKPLDLDG